MNMNWIIGVLVGLVSCEVLNSYSLKRELTCQRDGKTFTEGATYITNQCVDICLCQDDGQFKCKPCKPDKPTNKCNGWAHEFVKVPIQVENSNSEECHCFKYECRKKPFKSIIKELWGKFKNKFSHDDVAEASGRYNEE